MKEHEFIKNEKCYEINEDIQYITKNFDFNINQDKVITQLDYDIRKDINCVKRVLKR